MPIIALILTGILERRNLLTTARSAFNNQILRYISFFTTRTVETQRQIRYIYLFACLPVIIILLGLKLVLIKHMAIMLIINLFLFMLSIQILTWKEEAKQEEAADKRSFINTYATRFFAPLFWFLILPSAIGSISYLIIICQSAELKARNLDTLIYNHVVDKMLFYANLIPYALLFLLIALAGDFEEVTHYIVEQKKNFSKSFYFLENMLHEIVLIAIGKGKFQIDGTWYTDQGEIEAAVLDDQRFTREITAYIVAILYRASLFFIGIIAVVCIAAMF